LKKKFYIESVFLLLLGSVTSLSLPPYNLTVINFFTFSILFYFLFKKKVSKKETKFPFFYGWLFGFGYFLSNMYWIPISLSFDDNFKSLIPLALISIPAFLSLFYGLIFYFFFIFKQRKLINSFLFFSLTFGVIEFLRGSILTGFPWNLIVYSFANHHEFLSVTSIIGTYGLNLFCISFFTCPALFILGNKRKKLRVPIFFFLSYVIFYFYGSIYQDKFEKSQNYQYEYKIRIIGSNISLDRFYFNIDTVSVIEDLIDISNPTLSEKMIFVWPEGILPDVTQEELTEYKNLFEENFSENHILIMGVNSNSKNSNPKKYFNSLSVFNNQVELLNTYNKIKLVPFGEFLPFENFLKKVGLRSITNFNQSFSKGKHREIIKIDKKNFSLKFLPLICYEIIYSGELYKQQDFDLIINISEDGWFGRSIGPKQHFVHSIFRAVESGKYVLRSANNGAAAIINPLGFVEGKVKYGDSGFIDLKEIKKIQPTIFSKYGNKIFVLLTLLYIFLIFSFNKIKDE